MSPREGGDLKRFGGRWVRAGDQYRERHKVPKMVLARFWYLLVPVLGILWAHDSYIRPVAEDVKSLQNREKAQVLDQQDDIRAQVSVVQSQSNEVGSQLDTLYLPQIEFYGTVHDSLRQLRLVYDSNLPRSKARLDSLTNMRDQLTGELDQLSQTFRERSTLLRDLKTWRATMEDSIRGLDSLIALRTDDLYRKQHPLEYRRKEALFTGQGEYPRRDENPPREGGK
jgi:hypothetical protein